MSAGIGSGDGRTGERHANDRRKWFPGRSYDTNTQQKTAPKNEAKAV